MAPEQEQENYLEEESYIILKGRFKSHELNLYGLFLIIFNPNSQIESHNIVVSTFSNVFNLEPHVGWERYEENILDLKWKGHCNTSMTNSLMDQLKNLSQEENLKEQLFNSVYNYDYDSVEIFMNDLIYRIVHDKNLVLETGIQEATRDEYIATKEKRNKSEEQSESARNKGYNLEEGAVLLSLQPILAPVKGKPLYELKIGDKIVTKIQPNSDRENYFIDLLNLRLEDHIKPVTCEIIDIKANSRNDPIEILTQIGPGIYGKIIEDERQVKLRMYDPAIDIPMSKKGIDSARIPEPAKPALKTEEPGISRMTFIIVGLFALILFIFAILLYVSF